MVVTSKTTCYTEETLKVYSRTGNEGPEGEQRYSSTLSLTSALDGGSGQHHAPVALPPRKRTGTHCIGGWVGPRAGLDGCGKSRPDRDSTPGPSGPQRVAILTTLTQPAYIENIRTQSVTLVAPKKRQTEVLTIYQWLSKYDEMEVLEFKHSGSRYQIETGVKCHPLSNFVKTEYTNKCTVVFWCSLLQGILQKIYVKITLCICWCWFLFIWFMHGIWTIKNSLKLLIHS
jgi:hypothetical protein